MLLPVKLNTVMNSYQGHILIAQPRAVSSFFNKSCVLVVDHNDVSAWGLMINRPVVHIERGLSKIMQQVGVESVHDFEDPIYIGGPVESSRIRVVHSTDWVSSSSISVCQHIAVTGDISVLAAIAQGVGPQYYRACMGSCSWVGQQLEGEQSGQSPWTPQHRWLTVPANQATVFQHHADQQWQYNLLVAAQETTRAWF